MKNKIFVINLRKIILGLMLICILITTCVGGEYIVSEVIETSANNRLLPIYSVETEDKMVALTFDCAWGADDIPDIINILNKNDVKAAFFVVGDFIDKYPDKVKIMHENGMEIRKPFFRP